MPKKSGSTKRELIDSSDSMRTTAIRFAKRQKSNTN